VALQRVQDGLFTDVVDLIDARTRRRGNVIQLRPPTKRREGKGRKETSSSRRPSSIRTHLNLIINPSYEHLSSISAPAHRRRRHSIPLELNHGPLSLYVLIPTSHDSIVSSTNDELPSSSSAPGSVDRVDYSVVSVVLSLPHPCCDVRDGDGEVCRAGVEVRSNEGELEVEDGGFVNGGEKSGVGVRRVGLP